MIVPGMDLVKLLREHVAFEAELLRRMVKETAGRRRAKRAHGRKKAGAAKRKAQKEEALAVPYTLEPHPELQ